MFNFEEFVKTLPVMLYGMVGIFIVIIVIALSIMLLYKLFPVSKKKAAEGK
ncbi:MAG: OadG-related small transporter subunit [Eubacteriales bacterium]|nr:OadG-related small transporter subunit [Eubacteriales bacterium]